MKVTKLSTQKKDPNRFSLYLDGSFYMGVSANTVAKHLLYEGKIISEEERDSFVEAEILERFYYRCVDSVNRSPKSERQVRQYIKTVYYRKKGNWFSEDADFEIDKISDTIIDNLKRDGYIDDERYAEMFVRSRMRFKPRSSSVIKMELAAKGVSTDSAELALDDAEIDDKDMAQKAYCKRFKDEPFSKDDTKKINYLRRKGFSWDVISSLFTDEQ